jgi:hypothetical protein
LHSLVETVLDSVKVQKHFLKVFEEFRGWRLGDLDDGGWGAHGYF